MASGPRKRKGKNDTTPGFYFDMSGKEVPVPTMMDPEAKIREYVKLCIMRSDPRFDVVSIDITYNEMLAKKTFLVDYLLRLANEAAAEPEANSKFRASAYRKAANKIYQINTPVVTAKQAKNISGVGESIGKKIEDFITKSVEVVVEGGDVKVALGKVWGAGPKDIASWISKGVQNIKDLRNLVDRGEVALSTEQDIGVRHYEDFLTKVPRRESGLFGELIEMAVHQVDPKAEVHIVGSYARGASESSDVDILVISDKIKTQEDVKKVVTGLSRLKSPPKIEDPYAGYGTYAERRALVIKSTKKDPKMHKYLSQPAPHEGLNQPKKTRKPGSSSETIEQSPSSRPSPSPITAIETGSIGARQFMGAIANPLEYATKFRRVDIFFRSPNEKMFALLQYTASGPYNEKIREAAKSKGMMLNDKGLWNKQDAGKYLTKIPVSGEEEIFEKIGIKWVPVEERS